MIWTDPGFITALVSGAATVAGSLYAYLPYRANRRSSSQHRFAEERQQLGKLRPKLTAMALEGYSTLSATGLPGMLAPAHWVPDTLVPLAQISTHLIWDELPTPLGEKIVASVRRRLPWAESSRRFVTYSSALEHIARPLLFEDLPCYRLLSADLRAGNAFLEVGKTSYFRGIDESEALAHEYVQKNAQLLGGSTVRKGAGGLKIRSLIKDPFLTEGRNSIFAISSLTLRVHQGRATFFLHSRDSKAVAVAGSLLHLTPSGVFQPTSEDYSVVERDCSPWLTLCREYAEEFLGVEEAQGASGVALSYSHDAPYAAINTAFLDGSMRVFVCGLGLDPLTLCPELVSIACVDAPVFDALFGGMVVRNSEGFMRGKEMRGGRVVGYDLSAETVRELLTSKRLSPSATAALSRAWALHAELLAPPT